MSSFLDPSQADENLLCSLLGAEGEKNILWREKKLFCGASSFLAPFCICDLSQKNF